ncbi:MAG: glucose 1-dehydrogenase [Hyphomicrobiales bacterium]|nr:glucose 1-dehydrogenase [Hyphomicrobiales bacterium]
MAQIYQPLAGKVALVTGASSGIGRAAALELARRGAKVAITARRLPLLETLAAEIEATGGEALAIEGDMAREADIVRSVEATVGRFGRIDIAFNNAGTEGVFAPFIEQTSATYELTFDVNVRGVFLSMKHQAIAMLAQGSGVIINNASMGGVIGFENAGIYIASKHAVLGLTKTASLEWFRRGVRVNALCPGIIDTPFQDRIWPSADAKTGFANATVAGRAGTAGEMAKIVAFLASDDAAFISGHGLIADGGYTAA